MEDGISPVMFLDKITLAITGVLKGFFADNNGTILAESSGPQDELSLMIVRSFPKYCERLNKLGLGNLQSLVVEAINGSFVIISYEKIFLVFFCSNDANFSLLTETIREMKEVLTQVVSDFHQ